MRKKELKVKESLKILRILATKGLGNFRNETRELKDCFISYNPNTNGGEETALVKLGKYFILEGDHREALKDCKNYREATKVFKKLIKNGATVSIWSNYE